MKKIYNLSSIIKQEEDLLTKIERLEAQLVIVRTAKARAEKQQASETRTITQ